MVRPLIRVAALVSCLLPLGVPVWAGYEEGVAAYERGHYATALRERRVFVQQGDTDAMCRFPTPVPEIMAAGDHPFEIRTVLGLSKNYGASVYASVRQYVSKYHHDCLALILNPPELVE